LFTDSYTVGNSGLFAISDAVIHATCSSCDDGSIDVTIGGSGTNYSYNWSNGATTQDLSNITHGVYYLTVTDDWGCMVMDSFVVGYITNNPEIISDNFVLVYPNPANGLFNIKYSFDRIENEMLEIYDNTGRMVLKTKLDDISGTVSVDLQESPPGIYFVRLVTTEKIYCTKIALY
jgi:hypothetical protein